MLRGIVGDGLMVKQSDVFNKAAECERLMETHEVQRTAYRSLRDMWMNLGNESALMSPEEFARQFDDLDQIQTRFQNAKKG